MFRAVISCGCDFCFVILSISDEISGSLFIKVYATALDTQNQLMYITVYILKRKKAKDNSTHKTNREGRKRMMSSA